MKMNKFNQRSLLLLLLLSTVVSFSLIAQDAVREYHEAFDVNQGVTLDSDTKYADVEVLTWDRDVVDIVAEVEVDASSKSRAEEKLGKIDIEIGKSGNTVTLETEFDEGWSKNAKVKIHIMVKAPSYLNLTMESGYGDLYIQEVSGLALLDVKYGNLKADALSRGNEKPYNSIDLAYSNGNIGEAGWVELELAYSDLDIAASKMLYVESKYSKLLGEKTGGIVTEGAYDKYYFDQVGNFAGELKYSGIKFGALDRKLDVESKYTNIKIEHVSGDFKEINCYTSYGNIYLNVEQGSSFKIEAEARYGNIKVAQEGKLSRQKENTSMRVWGIIGSSPKGSMKLEARYGNIDIE
jgi:hypothetical protein